MCLLFLFCPRLLFSKNIIDYSYFQGPALCNLPKVYGIMTWKYEPAEQTAAGILSASDRRLFGMKYVIVGKNMQVTSNLEDAIRDKLDKLDKFFAPDTKVHVTLSVDKDRHKIEVTIPIKGSIIRSEQVSNDMYVSIDLVEEVIERQIKKYKGKIIRKHQEGANLNRAFIDRVEPEEETVRIVRHKQFEFKPMYPEDACVQMELLGHNFYVFVNAETEGVAVVYKRKGGTYGLIEPEA